MPQRLICSSKFDTILSFPDSPSFVGQVVSRKWHTILMVAKRTGFSAMGRAKLGLAALSMVVSAAVTAMLWPNARDALAVLAVQDDPAALADLQLNSALRNTPGLIHE